MTHQDYILAITLVMLTFGAYFLYWLGWCWVLHYLWPNGPQWVVRPSFSGFLLTCFTALIITLMILKTQ